MQPLARSWHVPSTLLYAPAEVPEEADACGFEIVIRGGQPRRTDRRCIPRLATTWHQGRWPSRCPDGPPSGSGERWVSGASIGGAGREERAAAPVPSGSNILLMGFSIPVTIIPGAGVWQLPEFVTVTLGSDSTEMVSSCFLESPLKPKMALFRLPWAPSCVLSPGMSALEPGSPSRQTSRGAGSTDSQGCLEDTMKGLILPPPHFLPGRARPHPIDQPSMSACIGLV